jgi:asparagine synthase (glutamine-hydrolysing)
MCGVFGVIRFSGIEPADRTTFDGLSDALRHRGPNGSGVIDHPQAILGMHRLSIMDVEHGWQPFWSEDGLIGVLGNGEIYNAESLRATLLDRGHRLATHSDIEVVPHLFEDGGIDALRALRGMFALVIVDKRTDRILLVRDRVGEKPLAYAASPAGLAFASEQLALVAAGAVSGDLDPAGLPEYLSQGFVSEPFTLLTGVQKVPAGGLVTVDLRNRSIEVSTYWDLLDALGDDEVPVARLQEGIRDAVEACVVSDVPVGIALSGGIDSSLVASIASRVRPDLHAFTVAYGGTWTDESEYARAYAEELGLPITIVTLDVAEVGRAYPSLCVARDEPIADIAGPSIDAVAAAAAAARVPVLMNGLGGDELFWGYDWIRRIAAQMYVDLSDPADVHGVTPLRRGMPSPSLASVRQWVDTRGGIGLEKDLRRFVATHRRGEQLPLGMFRFEGDYRSTARTIAALCGGDVARSRAAEFLPASAADVSGHFTRSVYASYLRVNGLAQTDRLTMRHSVEGRTPLVDYQLAELVMSGRRRGDGGLLQSPKAQLLAASAAYLPASILTRPKRGFTPPARAWLSEIWRTNAAQLGGDSELLSAGLLDARVARRVMARPFERSGRISPMALRLATLEFWYAGRRSPAHAH